VQPPPKIQLTKFAAFGDSITAGEDGSDPSLTFQPNRLGEPSFPSVILFGREYPTVLQQMLAARYTTQQIVVANAGKPQERAAASDTLARFTAVASSRLYEVILLMEGTNDIYGGTGGNPLAIPPVRKPVPAPHAEHVELIVQRQDLEL
jgi:lysophospholipase L1-like esterase